MLHTACGLFGLTSHHGTQLFFDENTGWVSHATADQSPKNLALQVSGRQGRILVFGCRFAHVCQIHFLDHDSLPILQNGIAEPNVEVTECAHNAITLQINGMFLSADSGGLVRADRNWCRDWELYTIFAIPCAPLTNLFGLSGTKSMNGAFSLDLQSKPAQADIFGKPRASTAEPCFTIAGFFNRSTSLDAVNRRLALELEKRNPGRCRIISNNFLLGNASPNDQSKLSEMSTRPQPTDRLHIIIHQRWPVTPPAPRGHLTIAYFFWEESMVRRDIVEILNMFDGVIVSAAFIKKSLILSGLQKPIFVVGYSPNIEQFVAIHSKKAVEQQAVRPFTFLHVSSCFPLKGVDVLLQAYAKTFSCNDSVRLIIKGYPNGLNATVHTPFL